MLAGSRKITSEKKGASDGIKPKDSAFSLFLKEEYPSGTRFVGWKPDVFSVYRLGIGVHVYLDMICADAVHCDALNEAEPEVEASA